MEREEGEEGGREIEMGVRDSRDGWMAEESMEMLEQPAMVRMGPEKGEGARREWEREKEEETIEMSGIDVGVLFWR